MVFGRVRATQNPDHFSLLVNARSATVTADCWANDDNFFTRFETMTNRLLLLSVPCGGGCSFPVHRAGAPLFSLRMVGVARGGWVLLPRGGRRAKEGGGRRVSVLESVREHRRPIHTCPPTLPPFVHRRELQRRRRARDGRGAARSARGGVFVGSSSECQSETTHPSQTDRRCSCWKDCAQWLWREAGGWA